MIGVGTRKSIVMKHNVRRIMNECTLSDQQPSNVIGHTISEKQRASLVLRLKVDFTIFGLSHLLNTHSNDGIKDGFL
jgi:hypothetical protein